MNNNDIRKAELQIISMPVEVRVTCPYCEEEMEIDFDNFMKEMYSDYPGDWRGETVECPGCKNEIEIEEISWD